MIDINKNYWLYVLPHVYCCIKEAKALLYNTLNGSSYVTHDSLLVDLIKSLQKKSNLGTISCQGRELANSPYKEFIIEFCGKEMGELIETQFTEKPVQMMPVLNLQQDIKKLLQAGDRTIGEEVLPYLQELNIYINNSCKLECHYCDKYFRQCLCCTTQETVEQVAMPYSLLKTILSQIRYGAVGKLNLMGGNVFEYPYYMALPDILSGFGEYVHLWNHYRHFMIDSIVFPTFVYHVVVTFPIIEVAWENCLHICRTHQAKFHFYVTGIEEYEEVEKIVELYDIDDFVIHPIYTCKNLLFFKKYIYLNENDILQTKIPFRQIFIHQKMNSYSFGIFTIMPDGNVYANINAVSLGNIHRDSLLQLIYKEMLTNTAWFKIRDSEPCSDCLFQYLCPSPSNYEAIIGISNLCHVAR
ncbi:TIGR04150 pseudo-rSAM protein [Bacteroides stercorirosoris]|uniref:TIGR04150 pseudo-rSAM protein n=1 Tax=Bacteroides stercorirosoris TaxID=871324 RepID=UPI0023F494E3|nr:TIGR04150 pseudo-rSAM protein [Bacteroides stercorirosoris]